VKEREVARALTLLDMALARLGKAIKGSVFLMAWPSIDHNEDALSGVSLARLTGMIQFSISILRSMSRLARNNPARAPRYGDFVSAFAVVPFELQLERVY